jgi:hypothetical protein
VTATLPGNQARVAGLLRRRYDYYTSQTLWSGPRRNGESWRTHSFLYSPIVVSARALSWASPMLPIDRP